MEIIRKYKTISILIVLIIIFGILAAFVKGFDIGGVKTNSVAKTLVTPLPTPEPFIHPESINIPSSYMGYVVTKSVQGDLGKSAVKYGNKNVDLVGSEWIIKKSKVSDLEYSQIKPILDSYVQGQLGKLGWASTASVSAVGTQSAKLLVPNLPKIGISDGSIKVFNGQVQLVILAGNKDALGNVEFKLFVSKVTDLKNL